MFKSVQILGIAVIAFVSVAVYADDKDDQKKKEKERAEALRVVALKVEPAEYTLNDPDQTVQLLVTAELANGSLLDVTTDCEYTLGKQKKDKNAPPPGAVDVETGRVTPSKEGLVLLEIIYRDAKKKKHTTTAKITVGTLVPRKLNFTNDIVPVLTKAGCNAGGCHGKSGGQNGFALSLLGGDPAFDYDALVKQGRGRRVFPAAPEQSLLLTKAAQLVAHGGGAKLDPSSYNFKLLRRWIEQGMPKGKAEDPVVQRIEVLPRERILAEGATKQQLRVLAYYSDNSVRDVTRQAEYKSQQPDILKVEPTGLAGTLDRTGEGAVMVRYMGLVDVAKLTVPFKRNIPEEAYAHFQPKGFVDELVLKKWKKVGVAPSQLCSDDTFIRRAFLDALGVLPKPEEVKAFLADTDPDKRDKLIDKILERNEYADFWANIWGDLLRNQRKGDGNQEEKRGTFAFGAWIRDSFAMNKPYDQFAREILTAQGEVGDNPPVNWYRTVRNQVHLVNDTSQVFLGTRVSCANCHNHPYEKMSQDDYWGFAAFFVRIGKKQGDVPSDQVVFVNKGGETYQPNSGKMMKPKGLLGEQYEYVRGEDPRQKLVEWMTKPDNPYFSRAMANRIFGHFMGIGIVNAVDDMRVTNPPSNPELLDALAKDFVDAKFDIKHLIKRVMKSRTYSLSAEPTEFNETDRQNYARYRPKRLPAEVLLDAVCYVTNVPEKFNGFPLGTRALELPDNAVGSYFMDLFGRSERESACECERSYAANLAQTLHLMNSPEIQGKISNPKGYVVEAINAKKSDNEIVEELYLRTFGRLPKPEEAQKAVELIAAADDRKEMLEDLTWTLLNSKEFLYNH